MLRPLALTFMLLAVSACGFKPMYGEREDRPAVTQHMASVEIEPMEDRLGQLVRNALLDRVTPGGQPANPVYRLTVHVVEEREDVGIRDDASITRANFRLNAQFTLTEAATEMVLITGSTWSQTAFDVVRQDFATVAAEQDAQRRLAEEIADEIAARMAVYFDRQN